MTETGDLTSVPASVVTQIPFLVIFKDLTRVFSKDAIGREILSIAFPAALALAADPIASLIDTAYIGRLGAVELAAVGVSIAIFNQASRITIFPIVSVTTSFVAQEDTMEKMKEDEAKKNKLVHANTLAVQDSLEKGTASPTSNNTNQPQQTPALDTKSSSGNKAHKKGKKNIKSASTAMIIGLILGLVQAIVLIFSSKVLLGVMGVKPDSAVLSPAHKYLTIRSLGAPALLLSLSMQGIFRGFKDTKTPLYATIVADVINIILDPIFIFVLHLGVSGAAIAHVISQYFMALILFIRLASKVNLMPPNFGALQFGKFLKNGGLLLARTIAVTFCQTLAAAMAARLGTTPMAAFQICLQVWLTTSLLADGLAELYEVADVEDALRTIKAKQRQNHEKLATGKGIALTPQSRYFLLPSPWLVQWKSYINMTGKNSSSVPEPELLDGVIDTLKCEKHTRLLERLPELICRRGSFLQKNPSTDKLTIIPEDDWKCFCEEWGGIMENGVSAFIETGNNRNGNASQDVIDLEEDMDIDCQQLILRTSPEVCEECIGDRESCELMLKLSYSEGDVSVCLVRGKEAPKSMLEASDSSFEVDRRTSKRSRRTNYGKQTSLKVSATTTVYQLKMMIWELLGVMKENQELHKGTQVIDQECATLADMNIFPGDKLWVRDTEIHEHRDIADEICDKKTGPQDIEAGFRGTLLAGDITSEAC